MIRNKIAKFAKETESRISSFKINRKICVVLAAVIILGSIGVSSNKFYTTSNTVLALSESTTPNFTAVAPTTEAVTTRNILDTEYNKNSYCMVTVIKHGGQPQTTLVREATVKKALEATHTKIGSNDVINAKLSDRVYDGMKIVINEVKYKNKTVSEKITYNQFKKKYPDESVKTLDKNGKVLVNKTVKVKYVNGEKTETIVKSISYKSVDIVKPQPQYYGTESAGRDVSAKKNKGAKKYSELNTISELTPAKDFELDKNGIPVKYKKKITGTASAYSCGTHTATGKRVKPGYIAVNPKQIPYGTKLFIRSSDGNYIYGYASAEDTGGFVSWGNTVADLYFWSNSDCVNFGRRSIEIYVLD